jgi:hypothetical protein
MAPKAVGVSFNRYLEYGYSLSHAGYRRSLMRLYLRKYSGPLRGPGCDIDILIQSHIFTRSGREEDCVSENCEDCYRRYVLTYDS